MPLEERPVLQTVRVGATVDVFDRVVDNLMPSRHADGAGKFGGANPVLAVAKHPLVAHLLIQPQRRILKRSFHTFKLNCFLYPPKQIRRVLMTNASQSHNAGRNNTTRKRKWSAY